MAQLKTVVFIAAALLAPASASAASFQSAVETILNNSSEERVVNLSKAKKKELASCIVGVLANVSEAAKVRVTEGKDFDEMQDRFGEIVKADRSKLEQQITLKCGQIATEG